MFDNFNDKMVKNVKLEGRIQILSRKVCVCVCVYRYVYIENINGFG